MIEANKSWLPILLEIGIHPILLCMVTSTGLCTTYLLKTLGIRNVYMHLPTIVGWFSHFWENEQFLHRVVRTSLIISKKFLCFYA
jgi:hypothetical protein